MPNPGDLLMHKLSKGRYWYVGEVPESSVVTLVPFGHSTPAYCVTKKELKQYYDVVDRTTFIEGKTYNSKTTIASFYVEKIFKNPDTNKLEVFGWYKRDPDFSKSVGFVVLEDNFDNWKLLD